MATREIKIGDLVSHYLYPRDFLAIVLSFDAALDALTGDTRVFVCMVPGSRHFYFFKEPSGKGWIYRKWLWVLGEDTGKFGEFEHKKRRIE